MLCASDTLITLPRPWTHGFVLLVKATAVVSAHFMLYIRTTQRTEGVIRKLLVLVRQPSSRILVSGLTAIEVRYSLQNP
jgi:hypothetical protein